MFVNVIVRKTDHFILTHFQPFSPGGVILYLVWFCVRIAVDLDNQFRFCTIKVSDKSPNWMLSAYLEPQATVADFSPKFGFRRRKWMPMVTCQA